MQMPYLLVLALVLLAQTKLFSATSGSQPVSQSSVSAQIFDLRDVSDAVPTRPLSPVASRTRGQMQ